VTGFGVILTISNIPRGRTKYSQRIFPEKRSKDTPTSLVNQAERSVVGSHHIRSHNRAPIRPARGLQIGR
jgi:hypothetical protein